MGNLLLKVVLMIAVPTVVFVGGGALMGKLSQRDTIKRELKAAGIKPPLNLRRGGYGMKDVDSVWTVLAGKDRRDERRLVANERRFMVMDLAFPFFYGGAFLAALLIGWSALGRPFNPVWLVLPIAVMVVADLTENLVQLDQLRSFMESGTLDAGSIRIASVATVVKIWLFVASIFAVGGLLVLVIWRAVASRP